MRPNKKKKQESAVHVSRDVADYTVFQSQNKVRSRKPPCSHWDIAAFTVIQYLIAKIHRQWIMRHCWY